MNWSSLKEMMMSLLVCDLESDACSDGDQISLLPFLMLVASYRLLVIRECSDCSYSFFAQIICKQTEKRN